MAGIFPPAGKGGKPPGGNVCNGYSPTHHVIGEGPLYVSPDCSTILTDCQVNAIISELLAAVDELGYPFNSTRIDNLGQALRDRFFLVDQELAKRIERTGDTMTGPLELVCPPTGNNEATCKQYVDDTAQAAADACCTHMQGQLDAAQAGLQTQIDNRVRRDGDTMTGPLILSGDPASDNGAATKAYVDHYIGTIIISPTRPTGVPPARLWWDSTNGSLFVNYDDGNSIQWVQTCGCAPGEGGPVVPGGDFLPITGGNLTGPLVLHADPVLNLEAATKWYVDQKVIEGGGFVDAPHDGNLYGRMNSTWSIIPSGGGIPDAPADGEVYGRQDNAWVVVAPGGALGDIDGGTF